MCHPVNDKSRVMQMAELRQLMFGKEGSSSQLPWPAWQQGFFFSDRPGLQWGLVQRAGGPCGLLAAMQVLCCAMLCCAVLTMFCCAVSCSTVPCYASRAVLAVLC